LAAHDAIANEFQHAMRVPDNGKPGLFMALASSAPQVGK
jgi:hypothetical protein